MVSIQDDTKKRILDCGRAEFLEKGFKNASLRTIAKAAGVTTGAIYGYFPYKNSLFDALVSEPAKMLLDRFVETHSDFMKLSPEKQAETMSKTGQINKLRMTELIYENFDAFKLIICCSDGTGYSGFIDRLVEIEVEATYSFITVLRKSGYSINQVDDNLIHLLSNAFFSGMFEIVVHDMPKEKAQNYIIRLYEFYTAGWNQILGIV